MGGKNNGELQRVMNKKEEEIYVAYDGSSHDSHMSQPLLKTVFKRPQRIMAQLIRANPLYNDNLKNALLMMLEWRPYHFVARSKNG